MEVIVIGNGMVGYKFCEKLRKKAGVHQIRITVYGEEPRPAYDRVHLSEYFNGKSADDLLMAPASWRSEEHTSELQSLMRISYAVFCLKKTTYTIVVH